MSYGSLHEDLLSTRISVGAKAVLENSVDVAQLASGAEERNVRWTAPRRRWNIGYGIRDVKDIRDVRDFWIARSGAAHGFRFRDWSDFSTTKGRTCDPPGATDDVLLETGTHDGSLTVPLYRSYAHGGRIKRRRIFKPLCCGFRLSVDDVPLTSGWKLDPSRGLVIFDAIPSGKCVTWGGRYDVPVRFEGNTLEIELAHLHAGSAPNITLTELVSEGDAYPETAEDERRAAMAGDEVSFRKFADQLQKALDAYLA